MNTRKQVLIMSGLLFIILMIVGIYAAWYPSRAEDAAVDFQDSTAERGAILFARNCRLCHGDIAEGGSAGARLPAAPALHRGDLQGFVDSGATTTADLDESAKTVAVSTSAKLKTGAIILIEDEWMKINSINGNNVDVDRGYGHSEAESHSSGATVNQRDPDALKDKVSLVTNTITCGRVGTPMPAWAQTQNGPLSDEQIRQLMTLITQDRWDLVTTEDNVEDLLATKLTEDMDDTTISMHVSDVSVFNNGDAIRMGPPGGGERLRITAVPKLAAGAKDKSGIIQVDRGVLGTTPLEHSAGEPLYHFAEVASPAINAASCGQTAQAPAPAGSPTTVPDPFNGQTVSVVAKNISYDMKTITVNSGGQLRLRLDNEDAGTDHNIAVYKSATDTTPASPGSVGIRFTGPNQDDTVFAVPAAGTYYFRCDVHPTIMFGTFTVK